MMDPRHTFAAIWGAGLSALASGTVLGQPVQPNRVEAGSGDVGPSRVSTRELQRDLRQPTSFESVYELQRRNMFATPGQETTPFFMRQNGGLTAVFPRSTYSNTKGGLVAQIPPNTVFYIGKLPAAFKPASPVRPHAPNWLDTSVEAAEKEREKTLAAPRAPEPIPPAPERSIFADEEFRKVRVARLLERAQAAPESRR
jgi:hypothetical protein